MIRFALISGGLVLACSSLPAEDERPAGVRVVTGKSLELTLAPEMKTREYGESERKKDFYTFYWSHPDGYIMEVQLYRAVSGVGWPEVQGAAKKVHRQKSAKVAKPSEVLPNADTFVSRPVPAPIKKGPFRGLWMTHKVDDRKSGEKLVETHYVLWDRKDCWYAIYTGDESQRKKFDALLETANAVVAK